MLVLNNINTTKGHTSKLVCNMVLIWRSTKQTLNRVFECVGGGDIEIPALGWVRM